MDEEKEALIRAGVEELLGSIVSEWLWIFGQAHRSR